jgi:hypothetical protein
LKVGRVLVVEPDIAILGPLPLVVVWKIRPRSIGRIRNDGTVSESQIADVAVRFADFRESDVCDLRPEGQRVARRILLGAAEWPKSVEWLAIVIDIEPGRAVVWKAMGEGNRCSNR